MLDVELKQMVRGGLALLLVASLLPTAVAGVDSAFANDREVAVSETKSNGGVAFISYQGRGTGEFGERGALIALNRSTNNVLWRHTAYRTYFDVDPLSSDRVLVTAIDKSAGERYAFVINWRTNKTISKFPVPKDTHDIDKVGPDRFAVADKAAHRAYVYNISTKSVMWEYNFSQDYGPNDGGPYEGDWTHLNDIDRVGNESYYLLSPRNFDRVILVNRSTQEVTWVLGEQGNYSTLFGQHDPVLLQTNPTTVLVGDSRNHRVVEYQRRGESWDQTWVYYGNLKWPRDADRFPTGNTIITDSGNDRVVEVTPNGNVVWEYTTTGLTRLRNPYDVEVLRYGDEPHGPAMPDTVDERPDPSSFRHEYRNAIRYLSNSVSYVLPSWIDLFEFQLLLVAGAVAGVWGSFEVLLRAIHVYRRD